MSGWTYYAPFSLGTLGTAAAYCSRLSSMPSRPIWTHLLAPVFFVLTGVVLQLGMIGLQGAFAGVLPVPLGRSIRGRVATVVGYLLLSCLVLGHIGITIGLLSAFSLLPLVLTVLSAISLLAAAVHDF
jgi:hypothetical protein